MLVLLIIVIGCREKAPEITQTIELSEEMKSYFVNYEVGTKWIYQDTMDLNNYDTIELISKEKFDVIDGTNIKKGYELYYKPSKSKDFKVLVTPGINNWYYVKVDPMVTAAGAVTFENNNGEWVGTVNYYDSIEISGNIYHKVIESETTNMYHYMVKVSKNNGIVFFYRMQGGAMWAAYKLIKTIDP